MNLGIMKKDIHLHSTGLVAEGLGTGLQNRLQRFESARDLNRKAIRYKDGLFLWGG